MATSRPRRDGRRVADADRRPYDRHHERSATGLRCDARHRRPTGAYACAVTVADACAGRETSGPAIGDDPSDARRADRHQSGRTASTGRPEGSWHRRIADSGADHPETEAPPPATASAQAVSGQAISGQAFHSRPGHAELTARSAERARRLCSCACPRRDESVATVAGTLQSTAGRRPTGAGPGGRRPRRR